MWGLGSKRGWKFLHGMNIWDNGCSQLFIMPKPLLFMKILIFLQLSLGPFQNFLIFQKKLKLFLPALIKGISIISMIGERTLSHTSANILLFSFKKGENRNYADCVNHVGWFFIFLPDVAQNCDAFMNDVRY